MENQLRIAVISAHSCPVGTLGSKDTGGMSVYIVEIARELGKLGHIVDAYTRVHDPNDEIVTELGENARLIHLHVGEMAQINKMEVYSLVPDFAAELEKYRQENDLEYDIIFSHYWISGLVGEYLSKWWNAPHVTMFHTLGSVKNNHDIGESEPENRIYNETGLATNVLSIIAPTEREKAELVNQYGAPSERISVVPCGVNTELFVPVDKATARKETGLPDGKIVMFVGRIDPLKGIRNLIEAVSLLENADDAKLVIVGGGDTSHHETEDLKKLSRDLGIEDRVIFTGTIKQEKMPYYYSVADVCVMPSYYESFGMAALESLACGTPVVANDVGDLTNIIRQGETGYVTQGNDPVMLAEKIALVLAHTCFSTPGIRDSVMDFDWENIAGSLVDEFRHLVCGFRVPVS